jgi:hypothetical protein
MIGRLFLAPARQPAVKVKRKRTKRLGQYANARIDRDDTQGSGHADLHA